MTTCTFKDVWLVPKLERSLLSVVQLEGAGANIQFVEGRYEIRTSAMVLPSAQLQQLWRPGIDTWGISTVRASSSWPGREGLVEAVGALEMAPCSTCALGKATKLPCPKEHSSRPSEVLELVHSDVCGPMRMITIGGARYFVLFIDNKSRALFPYLLTTKAETLPSFKIFAAAAATETGHLLKVLQSDHGGEYLSKAFSNFTQSLGIRHQLSSVATPQQSGVAECMNRALIDMARCLLLPAGLLYKFWGHTLADLDRHLSKHSAPLHLCLHSLCFHSQHILGSNATRCIFLGYSQTTKGYQLSDEAAGKLSESRDVRFDEESLAGETGKPDSAAQASTDMADGLSDAEDDSSQRGEALGDASEQGGKVDSDSPCGGDHIRSQEA
ncbi:hypothetical protein PhCBS80983_g06270 [Powellomyces hirtus]|uniref:Integrase catalytic domain-containing protein n=1 Tax=Powellomyces hirtus TaxID=109895 RepID=A0A507DPI9_9FUNG|nr:hypothetical protein PhCBS80983_g06270 [Powellomyces hirtus]